MKDNDAGLKHQEELLLKAKEFIHRMDICHLQVLEDYVRQYRRYLLSSGHDK